MKTTRGIIPINLVASDLIHSMLFNDMILIRPLRTLPLCRYKSDREANRQRVEVLRDGNFKCTESRRIRLGDIVRVKKEEQFPADMILLSVKDGSEVCYVETANLDGESSLKRVYAVKSTKGMDTEAKLGSELRVKVEVCDVNLPPPSRGHFQTASTFLPSTATFLHTLITSPPMPGGGSK